MSDDIPEMERRSADRGAFAILLKEMHSKLNVLISQNGALQAQVKALSAGFPDGDPDGHRRYHEEMIRAAKERADFWAKLRVSVATWGLVGVLGWTAVIVWQAFLRGPGGK